MWPRPWRWGHAKTAASEKEPTGEDTAHKRPWPVIDALEAERKGRKPARDRDTS